MTESKKTKPGGTKPIRKDRLERKAVSGYIQAELRDALDAMCAKTRRDVVVELSIALEEYLSKHGLWPPKESDSAEEGKRKGKASK